MSAIAPCGPCATGDHENHDGSHKGLPGVLGGTICCCPGDCKPPVLSSLLSPDTPTP